jgi:hypothetical protein
MVQFDGSHHDGFEGRGPRCVLMGYIDDATGRVPDSFKRYVEQYGMSACLYTDRHTTYKSTAAPTVEDDLNGTMPISGVGSIEEGNLFLEAYLPGYNQQFTVVAKGQDDFHSQRENRTFLFFQKPDIFILG